MRRAIPWLGLLLLAISFAWFVRPSAPPHPPGAQHQPVARGAQPLVVVLDPGHGGQDSGAMCGTVLEKDLTLDVVRRTERLLRAAGFSTVLTRNDDRYVSLAERASLGNRTGNSLFVSVHFNDNALATASGIETYYARQPSAESPGFFSWLPFLQRAAVAPSTEKSESLANFVQAALIERTHAMNRGTKPEQFFVITNVQRPAALVECGFLTNKSDVTKLATTEYRQEIALAISDGVHRYREAVRAGTPRLTLAAAPPE